VQWRRPNHDWVDAVRAGELLECEGIGAGVFELKLEFGPGYRVYFGKDGQRIVILLGGSSKKRQSSAITAARAGLGRYKRCKEEDKWH